MAFQFKSSEIPEVISIVPDIYGDERGYFTETYKYPEFKDNGIEKPFVQVNHSKSSKGTLRGLHYQKNPKAQGKLVAVVQGEILDVAVDIRIGSPTFGKWVSEKLNALTKNMLYIPEGFAHGFCVLSDSAHLVYCCTEVYSKDEERGVIWNDKEIGIDWPIKDPIISDRDQGFPPLAQADNNYDLEKRVK